MTSALVLFLVPTLLFVLAFLYETYLSFYRLKYPRRGRKGYVTATWEFTHTLLVFAVVMLIMMFTQSLDSLAAAIFLPTFIAAVFLGLRAVCYIYIFYVRRSTAKIDWVDKVFALTHVGAALFLVITVASALWWMYKNHPVPNSEFVPYFIPGLVLVLAICAVPIGMLYGTKD